MSMKKINDLKARASDLRRQLGEVENALRDAIIEASPVKVGDIVRKGGEEYRVTAIIPWESTPDRPWLNGNPKKKNGEWGASNRALYLAGNLSDLNESRKPPAMSDWHEISEKPEKPMAVELYYSRLTFTDQNGKTHEFEPYRDERRELGFWDGHCFCSNGTGHEVFEDWRKPEQLPTHWRECAPPPSN